MTIPRNDQLKKAMVSKLKSNTTITNELITSLQPTGSEEIREAQWQGTDFTYPNVRVRVLPDGNKPDINTCNFANARYGIGVFSEEDSSQQADKISGIIANELHTQSFTSEGIKFTLIKVESIIPAVRINDRTWMSEVILTGIASG